MTDRRHQSIPVPRERRNVEESLEVKAPFGSVKVTGGQLVFVVLAVLLAGILGYQGWIHDASGKERSQVINKQISDMKDAINEQTFILTLSPADREKLRLDMPESLRRKIGR